MRRSLRAQIMRGQQGYDLGRWPTRREARVARDRAALYFDGKNAELEVPSLSRRLGPASPEELRRLARATWKANHTTSRYRGVSRDKRRGGWRVLVHLERGQRHVGRFASERAAAIAHDEAALFLLGKSARLNFPRRGTAPKSPESIRRELALAKKRKDKTPYRGVIETRSRSYQANYVKRRRLIALGIWKTAREAAIAHDRAELFYRPERPWLNFPGLRKRLVPASAEVLRKDALRAFKSTTSSRFRGVWCDPRTSTSSARIKHRGEIHNLGAYSSEEEAAMAYDRAGRRLHGRRAKLNFDPVTGEEILWLGSVARMWIRR